MIAITHRSPIAGAFLLVLIATSCVHRETITVEVMPDAMTSVEVRSATNLPPQFVIIEPAEVAGDCPPRLLDPGLDTTLRLRRATMRPVQDSTTVTYRAFGDYATEPVGRYGEKEGEGVRIDCTRLRAIGVVPL